MHRTSPASSFIFSGSEQAESPYIYKMQYFSTTEPIGHPFVSQHKSRSYKSLSTPNIHLCFHNFLKFSYPSQCHCISSYQYSWDLKPLLLHPMIQSPKFWSFTCQTPFIIFNPLNSAMVTARPMFPIHILSVSPKHNAFLSTCSASVPSLFPPF